MTSSSLPSVSWPSAPSSTSDAGFDAGRATARRGFVLLALGVLAVAAVAALAILDTPVEARQGPAQKIFYMHVPAAWTAFVAYVLTGITGAMFLWLGDRRLDLFSEASAEVGVAFNAIVLTTGPIWAKPIWGTWWQWDARLTSTLFLFFLFVGYLSLRAALHDPLEKARYSAVVGILGMLLVPFIHLTVKLFRTIHPQPVVANPDGPTLPPEMLQTLLLGVGAYTLLYLGFVTVRYGVGRMREAREAGHGR